MTDDPKVPDQDEDAAEAPDVRNEPVPEAPNLDADEEALGTTGVPLEDDPSTTPEVPEA